MLTASYNHQHARSILAVLVRADVGLSGFIDSSLRTCSSSTSPTTLSRTELSHADDSVLRSYCIPISDAPPSPSGQDHPVGVLLRRKGLGCLKPPQHAHVAGTLTGAVLDVASAPCWAGFGPATGAHGYRRYHKWYYGSKLRSRVINSLTSLDQVANVLKHDHERLDHMNLTALLHRLQLAAASETAAAAAQRLASGITAQLPSSTSAAGSSSSFSSSLAPSLSAPAGAGSSATAASSAAVKAVARAVERRVAELAGELTWLVRKRSKWYDPRYAALVVSRTALLGHTDSRMLGRLTDRVLARLNEAYSRDLLLLLRGLHAHVRLTAAASPPAPAPAAAAAASASPSPAKPLEAHPAAADASSSGGGGGSGGSAPKSAPAVIWSSPSPSSSSGATTTTQRLPVNFTRCYPPRYRTELPYRPYKGAPEGLMAGVAAFLLAKLPTGRMPPENLDGLLRYSRALSGRPVGPALCAAAAEDLRRRLVIYAPGPLAGVLSTLAAERHPLPLDLLDAAADQFGAHAAAYGTGAAAARFLTSVAAILRTHRSWRAAPAEGEKGKVLEKKEEEEGKGAAAGDVPSPGEWVAARMELLASCLALMARDLQVASPDQLRLWLQALARIEAPVAQLAAAGSTAGSKPSGGGPQTAAAAAAAFVRAHELATTRALPEMAGDAPARLRKAYDSVGLPYPKGL